MTWPTFAGRSFNWLQATIYSSFVVIFLRQVEQLVQRGIYRAYITEEDNHPFLRGRLVLADHLQRNALHVQRFYQRTSEFTADVLENRILRYTLGLLSRLKYRDHNLRQQIRRVASAFAEVSLTPIAPAESDRGCTHGSMLPISHGSTWRGC